jgi:hypothetical protein
MDGARDIAVVAGEAARPFECHSDISLGFTTRNDDGEALFGTNVRAMMARCHLRGLELDISIKTRRHVTFTIQRSACAAEVYNVSGGYGRRCWGAVALALGSGSVGWRCVIGGGP